MVILYFREPAITIILVQNGRAITDPALNVFVLSFYTLLLAMYIIQNSPQPLRPEFKRFFSSPEFAHAVQLTARPAVNSLGEHLVG